MYARYRKLKQLAIPLVLALGLWLMRGEPQETVEWQMAICLAAVLAIGYIGEELWWIAKRAGRPCPACGRELRMKPFRLASKCPFCGGNL